MGFMALWLWRNMQTSVFRSPDAENPARLSTDGVRGVRSRDVSCQRYSLVLRIGKQHSVPGMLLRLMSAEAII